MTGKYADVAVTDDMSLLNDCTNGDVFTDVMGAALSDSAFFSFSYKRETPWHVLN